MALVGGVDGCKAGWLLLVLDTSSRYVESFILPDAARLFGQFSDLQVRAIDISTAFTEGQPRQCDLEAQVCALGYQEFSGRRLDYVEIYGLDKRKRKPRSVDDDFVVDVKTRVRRDQVRKLRLPRDVPSREGRGT